MNDIPEMNFTSPFIKDDAGRSKGKRPKQKNDCTVRALALAERRPYDDVYNELAEAGRKCTHGFDMTKWMRDQPKRFERISFPAVKGQKRMNPVEFCIQYNKGTYIVQVAKHVYTVIDGVAYDTFHSHDERCIYAAFKVE